MQRNLRMVVLLEMHFLLVSAFFVHGQSSANQETVIDLVEALNMPHRKNVTSGMVYKLRPRAPYLTLPVEYSHFLYSNLQGSMGVHVVGCQAPQSTATIFSLSSASSPILQIISSTLSNTLRLDYQAEGRPHSFSSFYFPGTNPFSSETWVHLAVSLEPDRLAFFVDCQEAAVLPIESENRINLELPQDVLITLGSTLGKRDSKFSGYLKTAEISLKAYPRRPWICNNLTDDLAPPGTHNTDSWTESNYPHNAIPSKLQANHRSQDQTYHHPQDIQSDQMQRAVVLQPIRSPRAVKSASQVQKNDRLKKLEKRMGELARILDQVKDENDKLQRDDRLQKLEKRMGELARELDLVKDEKEKLKKNVNDLQSSLKEQCKKDCCQTPACNGSLPQLCPPQPCPPQPCPTQPCPPQPCPQDCTEENVPDCQTPACNGGTRKCPHQLCPPQDCTEDKVPDCQTRTCNGGPPQLCPPQDCREENVPDCQTPACNGGNRECPPKPCPPQDCTEENAPRGCTQQTRSCTHSGVSYNHGDSWRSVENPCDICSCSEGHVHCEREQCNTPCRNPAAPPPNSCCPVCDGCSVNGHYFPNESVIPIGGPCQECTCVNGNMVCSPVRCPALSCHNPVHHAGECCPRCEQCQYESKVYMNGETFTSRRDPCLQCYCSAGEVSCESMAISCPTPHCSHPAKHGGQCCPTCNECEYEQRVYADGTEFTPAGDGPCLQCRCKGGNVFCNNKRCPHVHCSNPIRDPHHCCPVCKTCVSDGVEYEEGSNWQPEDPCSSCTCVDGEALCKHTQCPPTDCHHPTRITGSCCSVCDSCTYNHHVYSNSQRFTITDHPCYTCTCLHGTVQCERQPCPSPNCRDSYTPPGECCPKCPEY